MKTTDLDAIVSSRPTDHTAFLVTTEGEHWDPERPKTWPAQSYDNPPRTLRWSGPGDLAGARYGRLVVIGLLKQTPVWSLWLVRCQCGAHEDRTGKAVRTEKGPMCWRCDRLVRMQQGRPLEAPTRRPRYRPRDTAEVILQAPSVRRAGAAAPSTAIQLALAQALMKARKA
jgi:hypothetical protein